jgi:hypothetical protein
MRKGIEFSFAWLFAIIAGVIIVFLAIYAGSKFISTAQFEATTATAKELSIIFEPLETGVASGMSTQATLSSETRIYDECDASGVFGRQEISLAIKQGSKWSNPGAAIPINNKYIFSNSSVEGKKFYFFSMPFSMPFKIADMIMISGRQYCFINTPSFIEEDLGNLNMENIKFETNCSQNSLNVCFGSGTKCDMTVYSFDGYETGFVAKGKDKLYFTKNLIYPAIISSSDVYECNVKRLMKKASQLALVYRDESNMLSDKCTVVSGSSLENLAIQASQINNSAQLAVFDPIASSLDSENNFAECRVW